MNNPLAFLIRLLDILCPSNRPDLKGDFLEMYEYNLEKLGFRKANLKFFIDCLSVIPLRFIIKQDATSSTPIFMFATHLKIARRNISRNKLNAVINVIGLSVSLAACLLITLFVRDELSFDKHIKDGDRIYRIAGNYLSGGADKVGSSQSSFLLLPLVESNGMKDIDYLCRLDFRQDIVTINGKDFDESEIVFADSTFFEVFSFPLLKGNPSTVLDQPNSVVLDQFTAQKYFGTNDVLGKSIEVKGKVFTVSGVMKEIPENTHFTARIVLPMSGVIQWYQQWVTTNITGGNVYTYFKAKEYFNRSEFESSLNKWMAPNWQGDDAPELFIQLVNDIHLTSNLQGEIQTNGSEMIVYIFSIAALVILVLACINYVNLSLAASLERIKEVGMKRLLGSSSLLQIAQFITESALIVVISGLIALGITLFSMPLFNQLSGKTLELNLFNDLFIEGSLLFVVLFIAVVAGSFPALTLLRMGTRGMLSGNLKLKEGKSYFRNGLILFQFATSIALIASTLLAMDQITFIRNKNLGIDPEQVIMVSLPTFEIAQRFEILRNEMSASAGVVGVTGSANKVTQRVSSRRPYVVDGKDMSIYSLTVGPDFFETLKADMVEGRSFSRKFKTDAKEAYVINESAAKFMNLRNPVGSRLVGFAFTGSEWTRKEAQIIGVVKDFHFASLHTKIDPVVFSLASEITEQLGWMEIRITNGDVRNTIESLRKVWAKLAPERPFYFEFMNEQIQQHYQAEDRFLKMFSIFSMLSILIGSLGLFGLTAFMTKRRTKEIGIRKVLGASAQKLIGMLSINFLKLVLIANLIGWPVAYYLIRNWLQVFAYQTTISWLIFMGTGMAALLIAFLAVLYHSLLAVHVNPAKSLRYE